MKDNSTSIRESKSGRGGRGGAVGGIGVENNGLLTLFNETGADSRAAFFFIFWMWVLFYILYIYIF